MLLSITPNLQYILQPGGRSEIEDTLILGALFYITL